MTAAARPWQGALLSAAVMAPRELPRARSVLALLARFAAGQGWLCQPDLDLTRISGSCANFVMGHGG